MIVLRKIGDAKAVGHRFEEGRRGQGDTLRAIPVADMEDGLVDSGTGAWRSPSVPCGSTAPSSSVLPSGPLHLDPQPVGRHAARDVEDVDRDAAGIS